MRPNIYTYSEIPAILTVQQLSEFLHIGLSQA